MSDVRWVGFVGIPPLPRTVVVNFTAPDKRAAEAELARLVAIGAAPEDAHVQSQLDYDEHERLRVWRRDRDRRRRQRGKRRP